METINEILEINLLKKYSKEQQQEYKEGFLNKIKEKKLNSIIYTHPKFKVGQIISFIAGYYDNIRYTTEIIGFGSPDNEVGDIYVLWDCYWFPIRDEAIREIKIIK